MILRLAGAVRDYELVIKSKDLVSELKSYVYTESGAMDHQSGCFADRLMACAICWTVSRSIADGISYAKPKLRDIELAARRQTNVSAPVWRGPRYGAR